jgi:prepilin-type N-terminal cleavage/methylation domain-containing protein
VTTSARAAYFRRTTSADDGLSLIELIVSMSVFAVVLTLVGSLFWGMSRTSSQARAIDASSRTSANAMNELALVIRNGAMVPKLGETTPLPAFSTASREQMVLYSVISGSGSSLEPVRVSFSVNSARQLIEVRTRGVYGGGYWTWPGSAPSTTRNLSGALIVSTGTEPLFRYLDGQGEAITGNAAGTLATADLERVASVAIILRVQAEGVAEGRIIELKNTVSVPNLGNVRVPSP